MNHLLIVLIQIMHMDI